MQQPPPIDALLFKLTAFGRTVADLTDADDVVWQVQPDPDNWSLCEVMCHLRDVEREIHQARFQKVLAEPNAFLSGVNADVWAADRAYGAQDGRLARDEFLKARQQTVAILNAIDDVSLWQRQARHAFFGPTTLQELVNLAVQHDDVHLAQIKALVGNGYSPE